MKPLIVANWKMNPQSLAEAKKLFSSVKKGVKNVKNAEVVICPSFIYLSSLAGLRIGAQNCFWEESGAFTGEISPLMLKNLKVTYVIVGHSERRKLFDETNKEVNEKIKEALSMNLKPILCIGETKDERSAGDKAQVLRSQIKEGLKKVSRRKIKNISIAYEPIWAIGTGKNCSINETMSSILFIRKVISRLYSRALAENMRILYGGSVKKENASDYIKEARANGLLVGGASLKAEEFIEIIKSA